MPTTQSRDKNPHEAVVSGDWIRKRDTWHLAGGAHGIRQRTACGESFHVRRLDGRADRKPREADICAGCLLELQADFDREPFAVLERADGAMHDAAQLHLDEFETVSLSPRGVGERLIPAGGEYKSDGGRHE